MGQQILLFDTAVLRAKLEAAEGGEVAECTPEEARAAGAFEEDALSLQDVLDDQNLQLPEVE